MFVQAPEGVSTGLGGGKTQAGGRCAPNGQTVHPQDAFTREADERRAACRDAPAVDVERLQAA